jgi:hypothetical protein
MCCSLYAWLTSATMFCEKLAVAVEKLARWRLWNGKNRTNLVTLLACRSLFMFSPISNFGYQCIIYGYKITTLWNLSCVQKSKECRSKQNKILGKISKLLFWNKYYFQCITRHKNVLELRSIFFLPSSSLRAYSTEYNKSMWWKSVLTKMSCYNYW